MSQYFIGCSNYFHGDSQPGYELDWESLTIREWTVTSHYDDDECGLTTRTGEAETERKFNALQEMQAFWNGFQTAWTAVDSNGFFSETDASWKDLTQSEKNDAQDA